jgi:hypothetical protein
MYSLSEKHFILKPQIVMGIPNNSHKSCLPHKDYLNCSQINSSYLNCFLLKQHLVVSTKTDLYL